jgi:hypothetical protein
VAREACGVEQRASASARAGLSAASRLKPARMSSPRVRTPMTALTRPYGPSSKGRGAPRGCWFALGGCRFPVVRKLSVVPEASGSSPLTERR